MADISAAVAVAPKGVLIVASEISDLPDGARRDGYYHITKSRIGNGLDWCWLSEPFLPGELGGLPIETIRDYQPPKGSRQIP